MMYTYINHHAQPPIIPQHNHSSYGYNPTIDNSTIETTRNRVVVGDLHIQRIGLLATEETAVGETKSQP